VGGGGAEGEEREGTRGGTGRQEKEDKKTHLCADGRNELVLDFWEIDSGAVMALALHRLPDTHRKHNCVRAFRRSDRRLEGLRVGGVLGETCGG
jgi:hypothetical protein